MTQERLAELVSVAPQTIRRIERGTSMSSLGRLLGLASALGVHLMVLFDDADAVVPPPTWDIDEARVVELYRGTPDGQRALLLQVMECFTER